MGELARLLGVEINTLMAILPNGVLVTLIVVFFTVKFLVPTPISTTKAMRDHNHAGYVSKEICHEKEKRLIGDIKLLKSNDEKHFSYQAKSVDVLSRLDTRTQLIAQRLKIKEEA